MYLTPTETAAMRIDFLQNETVSVPVCIPKVELKLLHVYIFKPNPDSTELGLLRWNKVYSAFSLGTALRFI